VLIDVHSCSTINENNYANVKKLTKMPIIENNNFEEYNDIFKDILKNMNTEILSKI
jgi:hypothetical protein